MKKLMALVLSVAMVLVAVPASIFADDTATTPATDLSKATIAAIADATYTGKEIKPEVKVTLDGKEVAASNYETTYESNTNVGKATVTVTGKAPAYTGSVTQTFNIVAKSFNDTNKPTITIPTQLTGTKEITGVKITWGGNTLAEETDFTVEQPTKELTAGTETATIKFKGNYEGAVTHQFNVVTNDFSGAAIYFQQINQTYTFDGTEQKPAIRVELAGKTLVENTDYTVEYMNNVNAGTASVVVTGAGTYAGTKSIAFKINKAKLADAVLTINPNSYGSTGQPIMPTFTAKFGTYDLKATDYTAKATNNVNTGTATLTLTATDAGNFVGTLTGTFTIAGKDIGALEFTMTGAEDLKYDGKAKTPAVAVKDGTTALVQGTDYTVTYEDNINAGTGKVIVKGAGTYAGEKTLEFKIKGAASKVITGYTNYTKYPTSKAFNLNARISTAEAGVTFKYTSENPEIASVDEDGYVTVKDTGIAKITVETVGTKTSDPASKVVTVKVQPVKPAVSLSRPAKKQIKVLITKVEGATKYEVRYGRNGKYYYRTVKHLDNDFTKTYTTLKNRISGKTYYVKVRAIKVMEDGTEVAGNWSATKSIKAK